MACADRWDQVGTLSGVESWTMQPEEWTPWELVASAAVAIRLLVAVQVDSNRATRLENPLP
eukprot:3071473-Amphidinium_carterae.1